MRDMTHDELQAIKALCDAASPEPWKVAAASETILDARGGALAHVLHGCAGVPELRQQAKRDAIFIVAARTAVDALVEEVERLQVLLREGIGHHGADGEFCCRGILESGRACPTCAWMKRATAALEGTP